MSEIYTFCLALLCIALLNSVGGEKWFLFNRIRGWINEFRRLGLQNKESKIEKKE